MTFRLGAVPPSWKQLEVKNARVAFRDEPAESTVLVNGRCGKDGDDVPLLALTQHLFISFTERETIEQKVVPMDGREAMHTRDERQARRRAPFVRHLRAQERRLRL